MFAGDTRMVGEFGREVWKPDRAGSIIPMHALKGGGDTINHWTFNGVQDMDSFRRSKGQLLREMALAVRRGQEHL